jgi:hypothetical protein
VPPADMQASRSESWALIPVLDRPRGDFYVRNGLPNGKFLTAWSCVAGTTAGVSAVPTTVWSLQFGVDGVRLQTCNGLYLSPDGGTATLATTSPAWTVTGVLGPKNILCVN